MMNYNLYTFTALNRQVYVAELIKLHDEDSFYQAFLSLEELAILAKRQRKRTEFIFSRFIIKKISAISPEQAPLITVKYCERLKTVGMFLQQNLTQKLSLSHSGRFVAFSFCSLKEDIGIDIEMLTERNVKPLLEEFFSEQDRQKIYSATNTKHRFYQLWTEKEAVTKLINASIFTQMSRSSTELHNHYHLDSICRDGFMVSIAANKNT